MHIISKGGGREAPHARTIGAPVSTVVFAVIVVAIMLSPNAAGSLVINCVSLARLVHGIRRPNDKYTEPNVRGTIVEGRGAFGLISRVVVFGLGKVYACKGDGLFFALGIRRVNVMIPSR